MVRPPTAHLRAIRGSPDQRLDWTRRLADADLPPLQTLKSADAVSVYAGVVDARPIILKCWRLRSLAHRAYATLRTTRGSRHWRGARRLRALGIPAPECLALVRGREGRALVEVLIMVRLPWRTLLEHLAAPSLAPRDQHRLAETLARQLATLARAGWCNRDPKPSNLMVLEAASDRPDRGAAPRVAMLDSVAIRPLPPHRRGVLGLPLERLVLEAIGVNASPRRALVARFIRAWTGAWIADAPSSAPARGIRRAVWREFAARIAAAGDPTPTDNPLSPVG